MDIGSLNKKELHRQKPIKIAKRVNEETTPNLNEQWITGVKFYNIVDGQQRLTSISILLFELINSCEIGYCDESKIDLIKNFIVKSNASGVC